MFRLSRLLATLVVLLGLLPCELREALPVLGALVAPCCADELAAGEHEDDDGSPDCCGTVACFCATPVAAPAPQLHALHPASFLLVEAPLTVQRPTWNTGPPPTPPPIA